MACSTEIITGPMDVYWAPDGESMPAVTSAPAGNWTKIGTLGSRNYGEDEGVHVISEKDITEIRSLGSTRPECVVLKGHNLRVQLMLMDLSLTQARIAFANNTVSNDAGPPDINTLSLALTPDLTKIALLIRNDSKSPDFSGGAMQFEIEHVVEVGNQDIAFDKDGAASLALDFLVLTGTVQITAQNA